MKYYYIVIDTLQKTLEILKDVAESFVRAQLMIVNLLAQPEVAAIIYFVFLMSIKKAWRLIWRISSETGGWN